MSLYRALVSLQEICFLAFLLRDEPHFQSKNLSQGAGTFYQEAVLSKSKGTLRAGLALLSTSDQLISQSFFLSNNFKKIKAVKHVFIVLQHINMELQITCCHFQMTNLSKLAGLQTLWKQQRAKRTLKSCSWHIFRYLRWKCCFRC